MAKKNLQCRKREVLNGGSVPPPGSDASVLYFAGSGCGAGGCS